MYFQVQIRRPAFRRPPSILPHSAPRVPTAWSTSLLGSCSISVVTTLRSRSPAVLRYIMASPSKGKNERDNPTTIHFTGELKDFQPFKQDVRKRADQYDYTWVFDTGAALYDFYVSQNRDKAGSARSRKVCRDDDAYVRCRHARRPTTPHAHTRRLRSVPPGFTEGLFI